MLKANDFKSFILEVNTSARKKGDFVSFVAPQVAVQLAKRGVQLCVASDSHNIDQIGEGFREMYEYFLENGVHTLYYAEHKQIRSYEIEDALSRLRNPDQQLR